MKADINTKYFDFKLNRRFMQIASILFLVLSTTSLSIVAQRSVSFDTLKRQANPVTLTQAIQIALANNPQIQSALLSIADADQQLRSAWSQLYPQVSASANYTRNIEVPVNFIPEIALNPEGDPNELIPIAFGTDNNWSGGVSVSQTLFNGQAFIGVSASELFKAAQAENLRATAQGIVTQTRLAYYRTLIARERIRLQETQIERIQNNLEDARARREEGFVDEYAVLQLEVQLGNLRPQLTQAQVAVDEAKRKLLKVMGLPVDLSLDIRGNLNEFDIRSTTVEEPANASIKRVDTLTPLRLKRDSILLKQSRIHRGDFRALEIQQKLQEKQIKARRSQYLPTLSASYSLRYTAAQAGSPVFFGREDQRARAQTVGFNFSLPIFQGFQRDASIQRAEIQLEELKLQEYQTKQSAQHEILSAEESILNVYETEAARQKALDLSERGYERALLRYNNGLGSQQEVTDAQLQLRQAELNYAQMVFNYLAAKTNYDQAIGKVPFIDQNPDEVRSEIESQ